MAKRIVNKFSRVASKTGIFLAALVLVVLAFQASTPAQTTPQYDSRISRLEFDNTRLSARVSQLETQLARLNRIEIPRAGSNPINLNGTRQPIESIDTRFDRLVTLVIELREQVSELETRLSEVEEQRSP